MRWIVYALLIFPFSLFSLGIETIVVTEEPSAVKAVDMIRAGVLDLYGAGVTDPELLSLIRADLSCAPAYTAVWFLSINPAGPLLRDGKLNPFAVPSAREALNWLIDREYIVQEILAGAGIPQYSPLRPVFLDYARLAEHTKPLDYRYSWNPERGKETLAEVLKGLGAEFFGGKWHFQGKPVEIRLLIRTDARRPVGDYVASLLENLGFTVIRTYADYRGALRVLSAPPEEGLWLIYTNSLVVRVIERDEAGTFSWNYTPAFPYPPWRDLRPSPRLAELAQRLAQGAYTSWEERTALMKEALEEAMRDSSQIWLAVRLGCYSKGRDLELAVDLAAGLSTGLWARTLRSLSGEDTVRLALPSLLAAPLNPVAGSFTAYDQTVIRATLDPPFLPDPYNGLYLPVDVEQADITVKGGRPLEVSSSWLTVSFASEIPVPQEAWLEWDPNEERFHTVGEVHPAGLSAQVKVVLRYRRDLWQKRWHDGSALSPADFLLRLALLFDRACSESPLYDESAVPEVEAWKEHFRGLLVRSWDPLVVEVYTDFLALDAEWIAAKVAELFHPAYPYGPGPWHVVALLVRAEQGGRLAMSTAKAAALGREWASLISGPSLGVLQEGLSFCIEEEFLPYAPILDDFVSSEDIVLRYAALSRWFAEKGHFWVGNGPYYLDLVKPVEKVLILKRWAEHRVEPTSWEAYTKPRLPWVQVRGPSRVRQGEAVSFSVELGDDDETVPFEDVLFVKYLLLGRDGELLLSGLAQPDSLGFRIVLSPEVTRALPAGPVRLEVVAALRVVALSAGSGLELMVVQGGG